jgi:hypothetical protein
VIRALTALVLGPASAFAAPIEGVPQPEGWVGTTDEWTRGLGIALALLTLVVLGVAWRTESTSTCFTASSSDRLIASARGFRSALALMA